jgi:HlyD family secretion protein
MTTIQFNRLKTMLRDHLPRGERARRAALAGGVLCASALITVSLFATGPSPTPEVKPEKVWPVSVTTVTPSALAPTFAAYGRVESAQVAHLQSDLNAEIASVRAREGQWVAKDEILVELVSNEFELRVKEHEADVAQQQAALQSLRAEQRMVVQTDPQFRAMHDVAIKRRARYEDLLKQKMIAASLLDEAIAQESAAEIEYQNHVRALADFPNRISEQMARIERSQAELAQARIDLDHTTIRAPFAGPVLAVLASPGNHTTQASPLIEIADAEGFEIRAPLPDGYGSRVRAALAADVPVTAQISENGRTLKLSRLSSNVRTGQSGLDAFFKLEPGSDDVMPEIGRVVDLEVTLPAEQQVVALPVQSIYENDRVYEVVEDDRLQGITVQRIGDHRAPDGGYRVLVRGDGIRAGSRIITTQLPKASDGLRVQPITG